MRLRTCKRNCTFCFDWALQILQAKSKYERNTKNRSNRTCESQPTKLHKNKFQRMCFFIFEFFLFFCGFTVNPVLLLVNSISKCRSVGLHILNWNKSLHSLLQRIYKLLKHSNHIRWSCKERFIKNSQKGRYV